MLSLPRLISELFYSLLLIRKVFSSDFSYISFFASLRGKGIAPPESSTEDDDANGKDEENSSDSSSSGDDAEESSDHEESSLKVDITG
jgi:hypothetical protein